MTGTDCGLFTHNQSRSYLNHLVQHIMSEIITSADFGNLGYIVTSNFRFMSNEFSLQNLYEITGLVYYKKSTCVFKCD